MQLPLVQSHRNNQHLNINIHQVKTNGAPDTAYTYICSILDKNYPSERESLVQIRQCIWVMCINVKYCNQSLIVTSIYQGRSDKNVTYMHDCGCINCYLGKRHSGTLVIIYPLLCNISLNIKVKQ